MIALLARSSRPEVRNPLLALPAAKALAEMLAQPALEPARRELERLLMELARDAGDRARAAWRGHKAPMALYWKIVSVYSRHLARARPRAAGGRLNA